VYQNLKISAKYAFKINRPWYLNVPIALSYPTILNIFSKNKPHYLSALSPLRFEKQTKAVAPCTINFRRDFRVTYIPNVLLHLDSLQNLGGDFYPFHSGSEWKMNRTRMDFTRRWFKIPPGSDWQWCWILVAIFFKRKFKIKKKTFLETPITITQSLKRSWREILRVSFLQIRKIL
jgi:hypothetical protein